MTLNRAERLKNWAYSFRGLAPVPRLMDSPPTVTRATSTLITDPVTIDWDDPRLSWGIESVVQDGSNDRGMPASITNFSGGKTQNTLSRLQFMTDAQAFELVLEGTVRFSFNLEVDEETAYEDAPAFVPDSTSAQYLKFSFGSGADTYEALSVMEISTPGTGHARGDEITMGSGGGAGPDPLVVGVMSETSGGVTFVKVKHSGSYSALPTATMIQSATTGSGTNLRLNPNPTKIAWGLKNSTKKMRLIEIQMTQTAFVKGIIIDDCSVLLPWCPPKSSPRLLFVGDSQNAGTYLKIANSHPGTRTAQRLGLDDNYAINAASGTGWNKDNGSSLRWSHSSRIADIVALAPDICVIEGSQNDTEDAALQTAVTNTLNTLAAALPDTIFVGTGDIRCVASPFIAAGWANVNPLYLPRCRYIDNVGWITGTGYPSALAGDGNRDRLMSSDDKHLADSGLEFYADVSALKIAEAVIAATTL